MKNFCIQARLTWTARRAGGLFLGVRVQFPFSEWTDTDETWTHRAVSFGFVFVTVHIIFLTR